ncbi:glycosyltransferase family 2 protein [Phorcysia thermohydrogeniphila]|uniref:Glycosyltransferase involved in cell wall biosynthesis n=1 Tax=Phorcysia thermohydrogeniphila TaxID=936138 RepID=A0A4R1GE15_9BACT|nr:glycosyltransferase family 2 protein [Phorcysia thermohydrogeniphila]TCK06637.1 glycosyltransferase involved in cell wall biosynthesis [Phorcysia thermohydrogeniphila]
MKISACIIAKNEEKNLPRLLKSLKGKFDEIVLVDTGSTDRTKEIAKSYGCKVVEHEWNGFADARNRAVKEASGDWLWHFDADFELEDLEFKKALSAMQRAPKEVDAFAIGVKNFGRNGEIKAISSHIFIHRAGIEWKGKVHESPKAKLVIGIPVFVNHYGYADPKLLFKKGERNLNLLLEELQELPKGSKEYNYKLFFLVQTYNLLSAKDKSYLSKALSAAEEFLRAAKDNFSDYGFFLVYMYNYYLQLLWKTNRRKEAEKILNHVFSLNINLPEFFFFAYKIFREKGNSAKAFDYILQVAKQLDIINSNPFVSSWGNASECLPAFENEILTPPFSISSKNMEKLREEWKKNKGRNLGLLLYWFEANKTEKIKILRKLSLRYGDSFIYKLFLLNKLQEEKHHLST